MYLGDLTVNGQKLDLSQDPHWEGRNNESRYTEPNFHGMHSYGWSQTNWAGEKPGEIGGLFWRTEPPDPLCSYYGDDVGELTLDDPISFSGTICFTDGMTDAAAFFGYFNRDNQVEKFDKARSDAFSPSRTRWASPSPTARRWATTSLPQVSSADRQVVRKKGEVFRPDRRRRRFTFDYDPEGNGGTGRVTVTLDEQAYVLDLTPAAAEARRRLRPLRAGERPQRRPFGRILPGRRDLHGTPRPGTRPKFIPQTSVEVPYPHEQAGRRY